MINLEICGWIVFTLCMALLAIPAIRAIIKILKVCNNRTDQYSLDTKATKDQDDQEKEGRYLAMTSALPSLTETMETKFYSSNIISIAQNQERLNREMKFLEQEKESENSD